MKKADAIQLLGGTNASAARALGISSSAVSQWPDEGDLPRVTEDRVLAALWRLRHGEPTVGLGRIDRDSAGIERDADGTPFSRPDLQTSVHLAAQTDQHEAGAALVEPGAA